MWVTPRKTKQQPIASNGAKPFSNLVQQTIIQYALWLPGNQIMSGILPQVSRPRDNPGSQQRFRIISWIVRHNGYLRETAATTRKNGARGAFRISHNCNLPGLGPFNATSVAALAGGALDTQRSAAQA